MPALPPVPKVVRVDFHMSLGGNANMQNRVFFQYAGALTQADAQTWVNAIATDWVTSAMSHMTTLISLVSTTLTDLTSSSAAQAISGNTGVGTNATAGPVGGLAFVVKKKIARRYRGGHPKDYLPGIPSGNLFSAESWSAATLAAVVTDYNAFITAALGHVPAAAGPATHVNVSYFSGFVNKLFPSGREHPVPVARVTPLIDAVIGISANARPASQRRRNLQSA